MTWVQQWTEALFLHFPVKAEELRQFVSPPLKIDTFLGQAWLSYVFFRLKLRPAGAPFVPGFSSLVELNVRTYVRVRGQAGICFLRMYADNRLAIWASRWLTPLCYEPAVMVNERLAEGARRIECRPLDGADGKLAVKFSVADASQPAREESLDAWLLERYRLFVGKRDGGVVAAEVEHAPWKASAVEVIDIEDSLSRALGFSLSEGAGVLHYSTGVTARFGGFRASPQEGIVGGGPALAGASLSQPT